VNRRAAIRMTEEEALGFLDEQRTVICATNGHDGFPHLMPLWYVVRGGTLWAWTYAKSQKTKNLERDRRATLQVEAGETYDQLRGLMLRTEAVLHRDEATVLGFVEELAARYAPPGADPAAMREGFAAQAPKRVAIEFAEVGRVSWDHRKLGGTY
jgi:nitroimidazol reductase NimA-like FMN-containing flavoprotein (pyridoxamine 5'-phosphate oxidase superfamily)